MQFVIIIFIIISQVLSDNHFNYCREGASDKCLGDTMDTLDLGEPDYNAGFILFQIERDYDTCANVCIWHSLCFMASFRADNGVCNLYKRQSYTHSTLPTTKLFLWTCCDSRVSFKVPYRCPGFWKLRTDSKTDNRVRRSDPLIEFVGINLYQCQIECLNNNVCGALNYYSVDEIDPGLVNCQLIIQFPVEELEYKPYMDWDTFQWQCSNNYTVESPSLQCMPRTGYPPGRWIIENTLQSFNETIDHLIYFNTIEYRQCLDNCALYKNCKAAWYNYKSYFCLLEADSESSCADKSPKMNGTFTVFTWQNCQSHSKEILQQKPPLEGESCRILLDNKYTYIYPITCGRLPTDPTNLYQCWQNPIPGHGTTFSHNLHCQVNQSFRVFDTIKPSSSIFSLHSNLTWVRAFSGYQTFWLVNATEHKFPKTDRAMCDIFNSAHSLSEDSKHLTIIKRSQWFSTKSTKRENPYSKSPVKYVIISDTETPFCNCFSVEACSDIMRRIQLALRPVFFSIPYSFVVTGDGVAYEARGWDREPAAGAGKYNPDSFVIALCGQYKSFPGIAALTSVKKLIKIAIDLKKVDQNYTLYIYNDIREREYPYDGLRRVFELWPHYRGNIEQDCRPIKYSAIIWHLILIVCSIMLLILFTNVFVFRICHKPHCSTVRHCRIQIMYGDLVQRSTEVLPQILLHNIYNSRLYNTYVSPLMSPIFWIEDCNTLFNRRQTAPICSCMSTTFSIIDLWRVQSRLGNVGVLANSAEVRSCSKSIVFIFERNSNAGLESLLILHLQSQKSFDRFITKLYRNYCTCSFFNLTKYDASRPLSFVYNNDVWNEEYLEQYRDKADPGYIDSIIHEKYSFSLKENKSLKLYYVKTDKL